MVSFESVQNLALSVSMFISSKIVHFNLTVKTAAWSSNFRILNKHCYFRRDKRDLDKAKCIYFVYNLCSKIGNVELAP